MRSSGGVTQMVDRMESRGLLRRSRDPSDGRRVVVGLTAEGRQLGEVASERYRKGRAALLESVDPAEVEVLDRSITRLLALLDADAEADAGQAADRERPDA